MHGVGVEEAAVRGASQHPRDGSACESLFPAKTYTIPIFERATACGRTPTGPPSLILWRAMTRWTAGGTSLAGSSPLVRSGAWKRRTGTASARSLLRTAAGARAPGRGVPSAEDVTVRAVTRSDGRRPSSRPDEAGGRSGHGRRRGGEDWIRRNVGNVEEIADDELGVRESAIQSRVGGAG